MPISSLGEKALPDLGERPDLQCRLQQRTKRWHVRVFPSKFRIASDNMDPLPFWGAGCHQIALNVQTCDLPVQLHEALFNQNGGSGVVLKPKELRGDSPDSELQLPRWPPPRSELFRASLRILSLHQLPTRGECRPRFIRGLESERDVSGEEHPPVGGAVSSPKVTIELHPIGGFCCVSRTMPADDGANKQASTEQVDGNGFNARFDQTFHCLAAEPRETILRIAVWDHSEVVAYETLVLGTLRQGWRSLQLRDRHGTKIELCFLALQIELGTEPHVYASRRELSDRIAEQQRTIEELRSQLGAELQAHTPR